MNEKGADFVEVQLTPLGEQLAGEGEFLVIDRSEFRFRRGHTQRVTRAADWPILAQVLRDGLPVFEIVPPSERRSPGELNQITRAAIGKADGAKER